MKYFCRNKPDNAYYGIGSSLEECLADYLDGNDDLSLKTLEWFELKEITVELSIKPNSITKAKK